MTEGGRCNGQGAPVYKVGRLDRRYMPSVDRRAVLEEIARLRRELKRLGLDTLPGCWKAIA